MWFVAQGMFVTSQETGELMTVEYRSMSLDDYSAVIALWSETDGIGLSDADSNEAICRFIAHNPHMSFVAIEHNEIIGAVLAGTDGRRGYLHHLAVKPAHRRRGIGRSLVASCLEALHRQRITKCHVFVYPDNVLGMSFWNHIGFIRRADLVICSKEMG